MEDHRIGIAFRTLRRRRCWRQRDLAARAGVSQATISAIEAGRIDATSLRTLRSVAAALDAGLGLSLDWRGGDLDRLLDRRHAALVEAVVGHLRLLGWRADLEASFSSYGDRGSIDVLGTFAAGQVALVVEVKSDLVTVEGTIRPMDVKRRLAATVVKERLGWRPVAVGRVLVLPDSSTARRQVARVEATLAAAFPTRGHALTGWLRQPAGAMSALWFLPPISPADGTQRPVSPRRVRRPRTAPP